jgi:hypothetical protein
VTAAAVAAGAITAIKQASRDRRRQYQAMTYGQVCPHCTNRFAPENIELHILIAHGQAIQSRQE